MMPTASPYGYACSCFVLLLPLAWLFPLRKGLIKGLRKGLRKGSMAAARR